MMSRSTRVVSAEYSARLIGSSLTRRGIFLVTPRTGLATAGTQRLSLWSVLLERSGAEMISHGGAGRGSSGSSRRPPRAPKRVGEGGCVGGG